VRVLSCGTLDKSAIRGLRTSANALKSKYIFSVGVQLSWESTCFASARDNSKPSIASFHFCLFTTIWGICFSLESQPRSQKHIGF
jgi:hypothetical protein